ncbi:unnamed protein product [Nezara viridula]|uniref:Thioredoxin domain-containing protein n=1 Tax=Nezara viridula TaxID=85310 RepID=A0A9P0HHR0_NEZVI|nr:unnamed protein product [Nezara viridula]
MEIRCLLFTIFFSVFFSKSSGVIGLKSPVEEVSDAKDLKKILRTKNNVLVSFISSEKEATNILKIIRETADSIKGQGTMLVVECSGEGKKLCKKLKVSPEPYVLRHYMNGEFHKLYDRKETVASMISFMRNPTGDIPWEEDEETVDVVHLPDPASLQRLLKKETRPILIMFYAPWCGFCKTLKPEYSAAASELKGTHILAAIDVYRPENVGIRVKYNISGFPTLLYFHNNEVKYTYEGKNNKDDIIKFMRDPSSFNAESKEEEWSDGENDVVHLSSSNFDELIKNEESALIMFYAPWCGYCKRMKPEFEKAATRMKTEKVKGILAAVDATKDRDLAKQFEVKGYPTLKYFQFGELKYDVSPLREADDFYEFMKDPSPPPPPPPPEPSWEEVPSEVVHLSVENFKPFLKKKKHALVMFHAPWCGHCKMAKPEFQDAAEQVKDDPKMAFAAVDCTKHSSLCQTVGVTGYPTIKYYSYYNRESNIDYSGERKRSGFVAFLKKMSLASKGNQNVKEEL